MSVTFLTNEDQNILEDQIAKVSNELSILLNRFSEENSVNLVNPAETVFGSWWDNGKLVTNQYTAAYRASKAVVSGLNAISVRFKSETSAYRTVFYSYFFIDAGGNVLSSEIPNQRFYSSYVAENITVPEGAVEFRFSWQIEPSQSYSVDVMVVSGEVAPEFVEYGSVLYSDTIETAQSRQNAADIAALQQEIGSSGETAMTQEYCRIVLGDELVAVEGDTIQVFFDSIIEGSTADKIVKFSCAKGKCYPRYWEYTPGVDDVGEYTISVAVYDMFGNMLAEAESVLHVVSATNPTAVKHVLCVGDSTMEAGQIPIEASRRVRGTTGVATSPTALALSNIYFVGRKHNADDTVGWEGTGGWTYGIYNTAGVTAIRFTVENANDLNIDGIYQVGKFKLRIAEINVTDGVGVIRCPFYFTTYYTSAWDATEQTGTMTKVSGDGQDTIAYTAWVKEEYQPFWDNNAGAFDIVNYRDMYCGGQIDVICVLLGINNIINSNPFVDVSNVVESAKTFCRNVHNQIPDCKILVSTLPLASVNGGIAANYGSSANSGMYNAIGMNHKVFAYNTALIKAMKDAEFNGYVTVVSAHAQFDAKNGYAATKKAINTRIATEETLQSNAVHPRNEGYWQLSDAIAFRAVIGALVE